MFCTYDSPLGIITVTSDGTSVTGLSIHGQNEIQDGVYTPIDDFALFSSVKRWLDAYFDGKEPDTAISLNIEASAFRREVYDILLEIPYGKTTTYGEIARRIAKRRGINRMSAQAVGGAVGHNPISIIVPCHRVIGSDGSLTGYGGGLWIKRKLLSIEGISIMSASDKVVTDS